MLIVGVDCSTDNSNNGIATLDTKKMIMKLINQKNGMNTVDLIYEEISNFIGQDSDDRKVLICLDAPLGWPEKFGATLSSHDAGEYIPVDKSTFFSRYTDEFCSSQLKLDRNTVLDVAADKIAKTSYTVLEMINNLNNKFINNKKLSLVWDPREKFEIGIIEVYPRTWITQTRLSKLKYKSSHSANAKTKKRNRKWIVGFINSLYTITNLNKQGTNEHRVDALICCLIGDYFMRNMCCSPPNGNTIVKKEGWIWFPIFCKNMNNINGKERRLLYRTKG